MSNIVLFTLAKVISALGGSMYSFALSLYVLDVTKSATSFSLALGFLMLPGVIVQFFAGVIVDRHNKKKMIIMSDILSGTIMVCLMIMVDIYSYKLLLFVICGAVLSMIQAFFSLSMYATIPLLTDEQYLTKINVWYESTGEIVRFLGPMLGAIAYQTLDFKYIIGLNAVSFFIAAALCGQLSLRKLTSDVVLNHGSYIQDFKKVIEYIRYDSTIAYLVKVYIGVNLIYTPLMIIVMPYITYRAMGISGKELATLEIAWSAGAVIGGILISWKIIENLVQKYLMVLIQIQGIFFILWCFPKLTITFGDDSLIWIYFVDILLIGLFTTMEGAKLISSVQLYTPQHIRASFFGIVSAIVTACVPLSIGIYGVLLDFIDWFLIVSLSGTSIIVIGILAHRSDKVQHFLRYDKNWREGGGS